MTRQPGLLRRLPRPLLSAGAVILAVLAAVPARSARDAATLALLARRDLEIVDCLLPGQVRELGDTTYLSARRPTRTTGADCRIRGGEYVLYDRADRSSALRVWLAAAEDGSPEAQTSVGEIFERGVGGTPDPATAAVWYGRAAAQGHSRALFDLGTLYEQGNGVPRDRLKALNLYRQAAGVPQDSLMYTSAAEREQRALRDELTQVLAEKDQQIDLLSRQIEQLELRPPPPPKAGGSLEPPPAARQISLLKGLIARLEAERSAGAGRLAGLPVALTREPHAAAPLTPMAPQAGVSRVRGMGIGRYYALVIGNQRYQLLEQLQTPHNDVERVAQLLGSRYGFTVQVLEDADDVAMLRALNGLNNLLRPEDNLLIYYAGHGSRISSAGTEVGYWLPVNAERPPEDTFWVPNEQITAHLGRLPARRILVIADSCYAGLLSDDPSVDIFGTEGQVTLDYLRYKLPKRARLLLSSGGDSPVIDGGGQGDSVSARALLEVLGANSGILSTPALFLAVQSRVRAAAARTPLHEVPELKAIKAAGHELGDFFFVPRT